MSPTDTEFELTLRQRLHERADSITVAAPPPVEVLVARPLALVGTSRTSRRRYLAPVGLAAAALAVVGLAFVVTQSGDDDVSTVGQESDGAVQSPSETDATDAPTTTIPAEMVAAADAPATVPGLPVVARVDPDPPCRAEFPFAWRSLPVGFASTPYYWSIGSAVVGADGIPVAPATPEPGVVSVGESATRWITMTTVGPEVDQTTAVTASGSSPGAPSVSIQSAGVSDAELEAFTSGLDSACTPGGAVSGPSAVTAPGG